MGQHFPQLPRRGWKDLAGASKSASELPFGFSTASRVGQGALKLTRHFLAFAEGCGLSYSMMKKLAALGACQIACEMWCGKSNE